VNSVSDFFLKLRIYTLTLVCWRDNLDQRKTDKDIQIDELDYKVYLIKELEKEIESRLSNQFSKEFRVVISADAEYLQILK
jgi:hypothetical protein